MKKYWIMLLVLAFVGITMLAQENTDGELPPLQIEITGVLSYEDINGDGMSEVLVGGVVILPPEGFSSANYSEGQMITVTGYLGSDDSIDAVTFVLATAEAEATPEATVTPIDEDAADQAEDEAERQAEEQEREEEQRQEEQEREEEQRQAEEERRQEEQEREEEQRQAEEERREEEQERDNAQNQNRQVVEIRGAIESVSQNYIVVDGVTIEGGGIFQPSQMQVGQFVRVTGVYENNGRLRAMSIEEITEAEANAESTAEATASPETTATPEAACIPMSHPVVETLVSEFNLEPARIIALHCDGFGFGDIARALLLSAETGVAPETYLDLLRSGQEWGQIARDAGVEPSAISPERVLGGN